MKNGEYITNKVTNPVKSYENPAVMMVTDGKGEKGRVATERSNSGLQRLGLKEKKSLGFHAHPTHHLETS